MITRKKLFEILESVGACGNGIRRAKRMKGGPTAIATGMFKYFFSDWDYIRGVIFCSGALKAKGRFPARCNECLPYVSDKDFKDVCSLMRKVQFKEKSKNA